MSLTPIGSCSYYEGDKVGSFVCADEHRELPGESHHVGALEHYIVLAVDHDQQSGHVAVEGVSRPLLGAITAVCVSSGPAPPPAPPPPPPTPTPPAP